MAYQIMQVLANATNVNRRGRGTANCPRCARASTDEATYMEVIRSNGDAV